MLIYLILTYLIFFIFIYIKKKNSVNGVLSRKFELILASAPFIPKNNLGLGLWFENSFLQI